MNRAMIPGAAWVALIGLLSAWISQYFGSWSYGPTVVIVLGAVANIIKMSLPKPVEPSGDAAPRGFSSKAEEPPSALGSFLFGG